MEVLKNRGVRKPKSRAVVLAVFALTAGAAGRVMADPAAPAQNLTDDAGIARWVVAVDRAEEQAATAVRGKAVSVAVWQLAERIAVDHADVDREFRDLAAGGSTSIPSLPFDDGSDLSRLSGDELENAYVDREVRFHEAVLAMLASDVIPNVSSLALRDRLMAFSTELESELRQARNVQYAASFLKSVADERAAISKEISNDGP